MTVEGEPAVDPPVRSRPTSQTRGFLFADIRGYTEYLERHGAAAAADLLARYRAIVRTAIAQHDGAEIRTEGDSFYVVLPSASTAVLCALSILEELDAENTREPDHRIGAGIGVHAGEAIETNEGLVGSAVNIAARLSALARPGEVLVSETVRALTRSVIPVTYVARGRHRLKGVAESQEVFAAVRSDATAVPTMRLRRRAITTPLAASVGAVGLVLVIALVYIALPAGATPAVTTTPSTLAVAPTQSFAPMPSRSLATPSVAFPSITPSPMPTGPAIVTLDPNITFVFGGPPPLTPGLWRYYSFRPILVFDIDPALSDRQWYPIVLDSDYSSIYGLPALTDSSWNYRAGIKSGMVVFSFVRLQTVLGNPCDPGDTKSYQLLGGRPSDVIKWLTSNRFLAATNLQPAAVAGWTGLSVDVTVTGDPGKVCAGSTVPGQGSVNLFKTTPSANGYSGIYNLKDGDEAHFVVLDIGSDSPLVLIAACRVSDCPKVEPWAQDVIDTITVINE